MMRRLWHAAFLVALTLLLQPCSARAGTGPIAIVQDASSTPAERLAAQELRDRLQRIYPDETFVPATALPRSGRAILLLDASRAAPGLSDIVQPGSLSKPESFVVTRHSDDAREIGVIAGADPRGVCHGIYALLEKLGCGFYLSYETTPPPRSGPLSFEWWGIADHPLFADRIVLNWHNFLSSASSWEFDDWRRYIDAAARMRFNDLMVHAYGNNPMFTFEFNGLAKPVGYFATTQRGRDWGTQHVNDVRRMVGGEIFSAPEFGASIAKVEPSRRVEAATDLMRRVFAYARTRGLGVTFALDVDTASANPASLVNTLPPSARFSSGNHPLANPDEPEGFAYYRAQLEQLLARYPEITRVAVWYRSPDSNTPWRRLKRDELPASWQREFRGPDDHVSAFALAKIVRAFQRALREVGRTDVQLAAGSWAFPFLEASDRYTPDDIPLIALDWWVSFDSARARRDLGKISRGRKLVPIVWAHHDDRTYVGRPYTPFVDFASKLERIGAAGFGVIHWTTRPLDLYFKSTMDQTWSASRDQPLETACEEMAARTFGDAARVDGGRYLFSWITEAPMFGRETSAHFIDHPLPTPDLHPQLIRERTGLLEQIERSGLSSSGREHLTYFQLYERFMLSFFDCHTAAERAAEALKYGDYAQARAEIARADPVAVIENYVRAAVVGGITRGEEALVVTLNLRWLPHLLSLRQAVGLEPVRYRLGRIEQEPLAQGAYPHTYFFDEPRRLWKVIELNRANPTLRLFAISGDKLAAGHYRVEGIGDFEAKDGAVEIPAASVRDEIVITSTLPPATFRR